MILMFLFGKKAENYMKTNLNIIIEYGESKNETIY